jgi:predicted nuclease of predicted toxin-antitoxin system
MIKIVVDMNLPPSWIPVLEEEGFRAKHWSSIGDQGAADTVILEYARENGYCVLTHDLDFGAILAATSGDAPSVLQVRSQDVFPQATARIVIDAIHQFEQELKAGVLITIDEHRARARLLPLR